MLYCSVYGVGMCIIVCYYDTFVITFIVSSLLVSLLILYHHTCHYPYYTIIALCHYHPYYSIITGHCHQSIIICHIHPYNFITNAATVLPQVPQLQWPHGRPRRPQLIARPQTQGHVVSHSPHFPRDIQRPRVTHGRIAQLAPLPIGPLGQ